MPDTIRRHHQNAANVGACQKIPVLVFHAPPGPVLASAGSRLPLRLALAAAGQHCADSASRHIFVTGLTSAYVYCKVRGNFNIKSVIMLDENRRGIEIRPTIGTGGLAASLGSIHAAATTAMRYDVAMCMTCRNLDHKPLDVEPMKIKMSDYDKHVVIPYHLARVLSQYGEDEIALMVRKYRARFERIFKKWQKSGQDKCKWCRVGEKIKMKINRAIIQCWIIVELTDICYIRLSYGGVKIICP